MIVSLKRILLAAAASLFGIGSASSAIDQRETGELPRTIGGEQKTEKAKKAGQQFAQAGTIQDLNQFLDLYSDGQKIERPKRGRKIQKPRRQKPRRQRRSKSKHEY